MIFEHHTVPEILADDVASIFYFKDLIPEHSKERVVPTGHTYLIFELDGFTRFIFDNETLQPLAPYKNAWLAGVQQYYQTISAHHLSEMLVIQFKPEGAHTFIHRPLSEFSNKVLSAIDVFGEKIIEIRTGLKQTRTSDEKFDIIDNYLKSIRRADMQVPLAVRNVVEAMQANPLESLAAFQDSYPHSQQYLIRSFKRFIGLAPKYFQRILRFNQMLQRMQNKEKILWTDIAYQNGYADQSHFIKEFQHFSGFNPSQFIEYSFQKNEPNFFPLDRKDT